VVFLQIFSGALLMNKTISQALSVATIIGIALPAQPVLGEIYLRVMAPRDGIKAKKKWQPLASF